MGYTHYWYQDENLDGDLFAKASADCEKVCAGASIQFEYDIDKPPVFNADEIRFNGIGENGHETFSINRDFKSSYPQTNSKRQFFSFCKTAFKPYDQLVTACLVVLKHHFGDAISISSDGERQDWQKGVDLCQEALGYGADFELRESEE